MKFLIGVCGIGKGHSIREYEIAKGLQSRGHDVKILTYGEGVDFFKRTGFETYNVYVPMIMFKNGKPNWKDIIKRNFFKFLPGTIKNIGIYRKLKKNAFVPDVCISDYEPVVARIAYKFHKPLINIDQHSKFIYMDEKSIDGFSCEEEKNRLMFFFPRCQQKYVVSFYEISDKLLPNNVEILYPIIRGDLLNIDIPKIKEKKVLVYFSKYVDIPIKQKMDEIIKIFNKYTDYKFVIFSTEYYNTNLKEKENVIIKPNERESFVKELVESCCVITTAGHTLISEALFCEIPLFLIPLSTFDQHYCGKFVLENNLGISSDIITENNLGVFLQNIENYKRNIKSCNNLVKPMDTIKYIVDNLEKYKQK